MPGGGAICIVSCSAGVHALQWRCRYADQPPLRRFLAFACPPADATYDLPPRLDPVPTSEGALVGDTQKAGWQLAAGEGGGTISTTAGLLMRAARFSGGRIHLWSTARCRRMRC